MAKPKVQKPKRRSGAAGAAPKVAKSKASQPAREKTAALEKRSPAERKPLIAPPPPMGIVF